MDRGCGWFRFLGKGVLPASSDAAALGWLAMEIFWLVFLVAGF